MATIMTRVGPCVVTAVTTHSGRTITTVLDERDPHGLVVSHEGWPLIDGIKWALDYVWSRYAICSVLTFRK